MDDVEYKKAKKLIIKAHKGGTLTFAERNIIKIYKRKIIKQSLDPS